MPLVGTKIEKFDVINRSKPRLDGIEKVTGRARYAADIFMDGMLYAGVLRLNGVHPGELLVLHLNGLQGLLQGLPGNGPVLERTDTAPVLDGRQHKSSFPTAAPEGDAGQ